MRGFWEYFCDFMGDCALGLFRSLAPIARWGCVAIVLACVVVAVLLVRAVL